MKTVRIIESMCKSKTQDETACEDGLVIGEHFIAVIDGVTCSGVPKIEGKTSGTFAKDILKEAITQLPPESEAKEAIRLLNQYLKNAIENQPAWKTLPSWSWPQAAVIIYSIKRREIWSFGDCQCVVNGQVHQQEKEIDIILSKVRTLINEMAIKEGTSIESLTEKDVGREYILPLIYKQRIFANAEGRFAYDVLNGGVIHPERALIIEVPQKAEVILASDGYKILKNNLKETEELLAKMLREDLLCMYDLQGTKGVMNNQQSFDDRTFVRFLLQ